MLNWLEALLLGIVQGITEFLPISSSGHLILLEKILHIELTNELTFEVLLHFASLLAVIYYFRKDLWNIINDFFLYLMKKNNNSKTNYRFVWLLLLTTFVTLIVGKGVEQAFDNRITSTATIGASLIVTGLFLILIEHGMKRGNRTIRDLNWKDGIIVGLGQALAVIPGISRAGSTLIVALWCGHSKETAVRYSFLLSIPIITGITILKIPDLLSSTFHPYLFELTIAFIASFLFAIIGIKWLISMLNNTKLSYFAIYCIIIGALTWIFLQDTSVYT